MKNQLISLSIIALILAVSGCAATSPQQAAVSGVNSQLAGYGGQAAAMGSAANIAGALGGSSPMAAQTPAIAGLLSQRLGITPVQAMGGAGSIFSVARQMMSPDKFGVVSNAVPGMSQLLAAAPAMGGSSGGLMGRAASMLGGGSSIGQMAMLAGSFQNLGLNAGMVNQFIPIILQYVQTQGGASTMGLLQSALLP